MGRGGPFRGQELSNEHKKKLLLFLGDDPEKKRLSKTIIAVHMSESQVSDQWVRD